MKVYNQTIQIKSYLIKYYESIKSYNQTIMQKYFKDVIFVNKKNGRSQLPMNTEAGAH